MKKGRSKRLMAVLLCMAMMLTSNISTLAEGEPAEASATAVSEETQAPVVGEQLETAVASNNQQLAVASTLAEEPVTVEEPVAAQEEVAPVEQGTPAEQTTPAEQGTPEQQEPTEAPPASDEPVAPETPVAPEETKPTEEPTEETTNQIPVLEYEDEQIKATVTADTAGVIPEGVTLKVVPITAEDKETKEQYEEVGKKLQEKVAEEEKEIAGYLAYDITLIDADGNKVEPNGNVKVSMEYKKAELPKEVAEQELSNVEVTVHHLEEDAVGNVQQVVDMKGTGNVENLQVTDEKKIEKVELNTYSFSCYTITWQILVTKKEFQICYMDTKGNSLDDKIVGGNVNISEEKDIELSNSEYNVLIPGYEYQRSTVSKNIQNALGSTTVYKIKGEIGRNGFSVKYSINEPGNGQKDTWHELDKNDKIYMIYEEKQSESGSASGGVSQLSHQKYVTPKEDGTYDLTLNVAGGIGTEERPALVDVVFVLDTSGSMKDTWGTGYDTTIKIDDAIKAAKQLVTKLDSNTKVKSAWKLVTFSGNAKVITKDWILGNAMSALLQTYNKNDCDGGTNYEAALKNASSELVKGRDGATKIVVFLTDGQPTYHGTNTQGGSNYTTKEDYNGAIRGAQSITCNQFYAIGMDLPQNIGKDNKGNTHTNSKEISGQKLLEDLAENLKKKDYAYCQNIKNMDLSEVFNGIAGQILNYTASNVTITDTLSDYVEPVFPVGSDAQVQENPELILKITDDLKRDVTETEKEIGKITPRYEKEAKKIVLDFDDKYELKSDYVYSVTMKVKVNDKAKKEYVANDYSYPNGVTGQHRPGDPTSLTQPGFFSNKEASVTWTSDKTSYEASYESPVVQIPDDEIPERIKKEPVNFFLNLNSKILDTNGNITGGEAGNFTTSVSGSFTTENSAQGFKAPFNEDLRVVVPNDHDHEALMNAGNGTYGVVGSDKSTSALNADTIIRQLGKTDKDGNNGILGKEPGTEDKRFYIINRNGELAFPKDEDIFNYMKTHWAGVTKGNALLVNGVAINPNKLTTDNFTIRWYVFKDHRDGWHIDGILVPKSGILKIQKTFPNQDVADSVKETFKVEVTGDFFAGTEDQPNTTIVKTLNDRDVERKNSTETGNVTYTWQLAVFGNKYQLQESGYSPSEKSSWKYQNTEWTYTPAEGNIINGNGTGEIEEINVTTHRTANDHKKTKQAIQVFAFTNNYKQIVDLDLIKVSLDGKTPIDGAVFKLSKKNDGNDFTVIKDIINIINNKSVELQDLESGVYKLEEIQAPSAHSLLSLPIYFKVENGSITLSNEQGDELQEKPNMWKLEEQKISVSASKITFVLTIKNEILYELPSTGGSGIYWYVIGGTLLMLAAVLLLYRKNRYKKAVK